MHEKSWSRPFDDSIEHISVVQLFCTPERAGMNIDERRRAATKADLDARRELYGKVAPLDRNAAVAWSTLREAQFFEALDQGQKAYLAAMLRFMDVAD